MERPVDNNDSSRSSRVAEAVEQAARSDHDNIPLPSSMINSPATARLTLARHSPGAQAALTEEAATPIEETASILSEEEYDDNDSVIGDASLEADFRAAMPVELAGRERLDVEIIDFHGLTYIGAVDENLICPICKVPLVKPVITPCGHTFCFGCIKQACTDKKTCPVDRQPFRPSQAREESRLIKHMLDNLVVECPNENRGCKEKIKREGVVAHARDCEFQLVSCPDITCHQLLPLRLVRQEKCLHSIDYCKYCQIGFTGMDMEAHLQMQCAKYLTRCAMCLQEIPVFDLVRHATTACPETAAKCQYADFGCPLVFSRKMLPLHVAACGYQMLSVLGTLVKDQQQIIKKLQDDGKKQQDEIWELRNAREPVFTWDDDFNINTHNLSDYRNMEEFVMSLHEQFEHRVEEVKKNLTDLEGRQTVMVLNHIMPISDHITEVRSTIGVLKMHVAWLLNKSREEVERSRMANRNVRGGGAARGRGSSDSDGEVPSTPRRLSDSSNGIPRL